MKYIAQNQADQPIHDLMDDIAAAYQKADKSGGHPLKILMAIGYMQTLYAKEKQFSDAEIQTTRDITKLATESYKRGSDN